MRQKAGIIVVLFLTNESLIVNRVGNIIGIIYRGWHPLMVSNPTGVNETYREVAARAMLTKLMRRIQGTSILLNPIELMPSPSLSNTATTTRIKKGIVEIQVKALSRVPR